MARRKGRRKKGRGLAPGLIPGQPAGKHKPFKSQAQWRMFFADPKLRKYAIGKAHATGPEHGVGYHSIPKRKGVKRKARGIKK